MTSRCTIALYNCLMAQTNFTNDELRHANVQFAPIETVYVEDWSEAIAKLDWYDMSFRDSLETCFAGAFGILVAAAAFPLGAFMAMAILNLRRFTVLPGAEAIVAFLFYGMMGTGCAIAAGMLGVFFSIIIVAAANTSFGFPFRADVQIKWTGALTGFLCVGWLILIPLRETWIQSNTCLLYTSDAADE